MTTTHAVVLVAARALAPADVAPLVETARAARGVFGGEVVVVTAGPLSPELIALALASAGLDREVEVLRGGAAAGERQRAGLRAALARRADAIATLVTASWARVAGEIAADLRALAGALEATGADGVLGVRGGGAPLLGRVLGGVSGARRGDLLGAGLRLWRRRALERVDLAGLSGGEAFELELVLALLERDARVTSTPCALAGRLGPLQDPLGAVGFAVGALRAGARAALARARNRLAFPGPPDLPASPAPSVGPGSGSRRRSLPVASPGGEGFS